MSRQLKHLAPGIRNKFNDKIENNRNNGKLLGSVSPNVCDRKIDLDLEHCTVAHVPAMLRDPVHTKISKYCLV